MATIPSQCGTCGAIFPSRMISIEGNVENLVLSNNSETCPFCGGRAFLAEGVFDIAQDVISIINAPSVTKEMLKKLGDAVEKAYKDSSKTDQLNSVAESIDPKIAETVSKITSGNKLKVGLGLFLLAMALKSCSVNVNLDVNKLVDQLKEQPPQVTKIETFRM